MKRQLALLLMRRIRVEGPLRDPEVTAWPLPLAVALPPILLLIQILNLAPTLTLTLALTLTLTLILTLTLTLTLTRLRLGDARAFRAGRHRGRVGVASRHAERRIAAGG